MTKDELLTLQTKLQNAVTFGVQSKGNLQWAEAQLAAVKHALATQYPEQLIVTPAIGERLRNAGIPRGHRSI